MAKNLFRSLGAAAFGLFLIAFLTHFVTQRVIGQVPGNMVPNGGQNAVPAQPLPKGLDGRHVIDLRQTVLPAINQPTAPMDYRSETFQERFDELLPEEKVGIAIYENRNRSVVNIDTTMVREGPFYTMQEAEGLGSGIVLSKDGVILTNYHVVKGANTIKVTLFDGNEYEAFKIGTDWRTDIALLKIEAPAESLFPVEFGDSSRVLVGQTVYAIGNPFGLERTMTRGIVSNLNRTIESPSEKEEGTSRIIRGVIQTDAAINAGNSGGALFDSRGRMIGMNTAIASRVGENSGIGFAIPVNTISRIAGILLNEGEVVRGDIGILRVNEMEMGLVPVQIEDGGAADKAGLLGGKLIPTVIRQNGMTFRGYKKVTPKGGFDIITGVNGEKIRTAEDFISAVEEHKPGETIQLDLLRNNQPVQIPVTLD